MEQLFGVVLSLILVGVMLVPLITFARLGKISRELEQLTRRVRALEAGRAGAGESIASEVAVSVVAPGAPGAPVAPEHRTAPVAPVAPVAPTAPVAPRAPGVPSAPDLESRIGGRGLLYTGVIVLLFGVSFFLKYAFDNAWVNETGRVVIGALAGLALIGGGARMARRDLAVFGQALIGTGLATLYLVIYAAINFYGLINPVVAFMAMGLVTFGAAALANSHRSQALAFIAVGGGFLTPFLVGGDENAQLTLFTYDAVLVGATLLLAVRHQWVVLNAMSYLLTLMTVLAWSGRHYTDDQWLRTLLFLTLFCVLFLRIVRVTLRTRTIAARIVVGILASAPVFYHVTAVVMTTAHAPAIHIYLIAFTATGLWLTAEPHRPWIRLLVLLAGFAPMLGSATLPAGLSWTMANVVTIVAVAALHIIAIIDRVMRQGATLRTPDLLSLQLSGLGLFALLYTALQPVYPNLRGALAILVALPAVAMWWWWQSRDRVAALNAAALAFTLGAIGVSVEFDGAPVVVGWAAEGAAIAWLGMRAPSIVFQFGGLVLWAFAALRLLDGYFVTPFNFTAFLNVRALTTAFVIAMGYALAWTFNRVAGPHSQRTRAALHVAASMLTLIWISAEIQSYWEVRSSTTQAYYKQLMLSLAWGVYGAVLIAFGMRRSYAPVRYIGMATIAITVLKVFFYDLWELGGIYRVVGFLSFGILLVLVSYLYQKRRAAPIHEDTTPPTPEAAAPAVPEDATP